MPLPKPREGEPKDAFVSRCMGDNVMKNEFPKNDNRLAVCYNIFERSKKGELDKQYMKSLSKRNKNE